MTDPDGLGPRLESQLRSALDRVQPPHSAPRYLDAARTGRRWGLSQGLLAAGIAALMVLTLLGAAASRSIDLQHRIVNTIEFATQPTAGTAPESSPSPSPEDVQQPAPAEESSPRPEPSETAEPSQKPEPGDSSSDSSGEHSSSTPTPTPGDH